MAMNVFGNPITDSTLKGMPEYADKVITQKDRATVALNMKNARGNDVNVLTYVEKVGEKSDFGITTLCVVYNATGDTITFVDSHDWSGHIAQNPYPISIANGQWGGFVHVSGGTDSGSHAGVVYRGKNQSGKECDWMLSWLNAENRYYGNSVYTEVRAKGHHQGDLWEIVYGLRDKFAKLVMRDTCDECMSSASTGSSHKAVVEAIFTLENA